MKAHAIDHGFLVRLDKGEEIISSLVDFCAKEKILFASVSGIGAVGKAKLAVFDTKKKEYLEREFAGDFEIVSLSGNVTIAQGKVKPHLHVCIAGNDSQIETQFGNSPSNISDGVHFLAHAGHLVFAEVSVTCEIILNVSEGRIERKKDTETGLMLID